MSKPLVIKRGKSQVGHAYNSRTGDAEVEGSWVQVQAHRMGYMCETPHTKKKEGGNSKVSCLPTEFTTFQFNIKPYNFLYVDSFAYC
jgi:hypothetical protein